MERCARLDCTVPISREHRYVVNERLSATGEILIPIDKKQILDLVANLSNQGYQSIAVGLIHSYANDRHEKYIKNILSKHFPKTMLSISSEVSPQMREYERFNTVCANAYVKPLIKSYLMRLKKKLWLFFNVEKGTCKNHVKINNDIVKTKQTEQPQTTT